LIAALTRARFVTPTARAGKTSYTFQDVLMLRTASALKAAKISTPKITAALRNMRATLPPGSVLATPALAASGNDLVVHEAPAPPQSPAHAEAETHYARGHALEESDVAAARAAYLDALNAHSEHLDARINLGRLLHLDGELKEAEKVYRTAKNSSALLSFNLAILLEDLNREDEAIAAYREALARDPSLHDAHFNLSRLHERARQPREALRHLLAYRRHSSRPGAPKL